MRVDPHVVYDGFTSVSDGVNSGLPADQIPATQFSFASNVTFRGRLPKVRPPFVKRILKFQNSNGTVNATLRTNFQSGIYQGAIGFERRKQIVASIGGRLFRIRPDIWDVLDVTPYPSGSSVSPATSSFYRAWFCEAEDFIIRQDGQTAPWIYDGGFTRPSDPLGINGIKEIPVGKAMVYSQGRLVVALPDGRSFVVGDIVGGPSGTPQYNFKDAILRFTENDIINEGGSFSVPINAGPITGFRPVAQTDTSTGQGPTQIFTQSAIFSLNTPPDRTTWKNLNYPIQTFSVVQAGALSDRSTIQVNGDIWMRSLDGVRSFVVARRDFGSWVNTPQSFEMIRALEQDDQSLLGYSSSALFDNRLLISTQPYREFGHGVVHRGLSVIDFTPVAYLGSSTKPVWEGIWCGLNILQILSCNFSGQDRCFVFSLNPDNEIELWELQTTGTVDFNGTDEIQISGFVETNSYGFASAGTTTRSGSPGGLNLLKLLKAYLWVEDISGRCVIRSSYRAGTDPAWHDWHQWDFCAQTVTCGTAGQCTVPMNLRNQYRGGFILPEPEGACNTQTDQPDNVGEQFQVRFDFLGSFTFSRMLIAASTEQQNVTDVCPTSESCVAVEYCGTSDFLYSVYV